MSTSHYLFRFDAGAEYGLGHYSRCLAIANSLLKAEPGAGISILSEATDYMAAQKEYLPFNIVLADKIDGKGLLSHVQKSRPDVLFFDKFEELDTDIITELKEYTKVILFQNYFQSAGLADAVIIPAAHVDKSRLPFANAIQGELKPVYIGPEYVVINEKVIPLKGKFVFSDQAASIAITTGGTDPAGVMLSLLDKIDFNRFASVSFKFLIGDNFIYRNKLTEYNTIPNVNFAAFDMRELVRSDLAIATFGVTTYELLYLGIPLISVSHARSNAEGSKYLSEHCSCFTDLGLMSNVGAGQINTSIDKLMKDAVLRRSYHDNGAGLIDGNGTERVRDIIMGIRS